MNTNVQHTNYSCVTIKAVLHYHERGLLAEPPRDASGYRRYSAAHAVDLIKIKTLAEAGVPLARIKELLAADPDRFAAAVAEIDRNLQERAAELQRTRERIARLGAGDRLFVSPEVADFLDRLRGIGVSERGVRMERDMWILLQSVSPEQAADWNTGSIAGLRTISGSYRPQLTTSRSVTRAGSRRYRLTNSTIGSNSGPPPWSPTPSVNTSEPDSSASDENRPGARTAADSAAIAPKLAPSRLHSPVSG